MPSTSAPPTGRMCTTRNERSGRARACSARSPFTMTAAEAIELEGLAEGHGVFLMEAMWMKFSPSMRHAIELVEAGEIGEPRFVQAGLGYPVPPDGPQRSLGCRARWRRALRHGRLHHRAGTPVPRHPRRGPRLRFDPGRRSRPLRRRDALLFVGRTRTADDLDHLPHPTLGIRRRHRGSIAFGEPLFSPNSFQIAKGRPPKPPTIDQLEFQREGAGYVPMFRAAGGAILAGESQHPLHPVGATVDVSATMELVRDRLIAQRDAAGG